MWFLFIVGICCFAQTDIVRRGGTASVDFFNFNYSSKNNGFEMVKEAFSGIFRTEKHVLYLKQLLIFKYKLTYHQKNF